MKEKRQGEILSIISTTAVETQEQLLEELKKRGIGATQATISRDIKELHLVKELTGTGSYHYGQTQRKNAANVTGRLKTIFREGVVSYDHAQNLVVVKTMPGLGPAAGAALDGMDIPERVGSLAGDDTVLLVLRTTESAKEFCQTIREMLQ